MTKLIEVPCETEGCHRTLKTFIPHQIKTCCVCNYKRQLKNKTLKELGLL